MIAPLGVPLIMTYSEFLGFDQHQQRHGATQQLLITVGVDGVVWEDVWDPKHPLLQCYAAAHLHCAKKCLLTCACGRGLSTKH